MLFMSSMLAPVFVTITVILIRTQTSAQETSVFYVLSDDQQSSFNQYRVTKNCTLEALLSSNILSDNVSNTVVILNPRVHTINSTVNQVFSINNATNFTLTAANLSERIIVKCNGKVGFSFKFCNNLTIQGINFEGCTGHQITTINQNRNLITFSDFALHILFSADINISAIMARNSGGIGLLVINVRGSFMLSDSVFTNNTCSNVWLFSNDSVNIISRDTVIDIKNSWFEQVTSCSHNNDSTYIHPIGVVLTLIQAFKFKIMALSLSNVTLTQTSISIRGRCKLQISLSNISVKNIFYRKNNPIVITNVSSIIMKDITIQRTKGSVIFRRCNLSLQGQFIYRDNWGSLVLLKTEVTVYNTTVIIRNNVAIPYAPLLAYWSKIGIQKSYLSVNGNTGQGSGGIALAGTTVNFRDDSKAMFLFNTGHWGGAMAFYQKSKLLFHDGQINFTFVGNHAIINGGAIYVRDTDYTRYSLFTIREEKQFYINFFSTYKGGQPRFHYYNNTAGQAGSAVYGGNVSNSDIFYFHNVSVNDTSVVSSIPFRVCTCVYSKPNCSIAKLTAKVQPGQSYTIEIITVGQRNGTSPSTVEANFIGSSQAQLKQTEYRQSIGNTCANLTYTVRFSSHREELQLKTLYSTWRVKVPFSIIFDRKDCTIGSIFDSKMVRCICNQDIIDHGMKCDIQTLKINRLPSKWINVTYEHLDPRVQQHGVIVHDYCPFDYCLANPQQLDLHYPDQQCNQNRVGILCGACSNNFSHILGTSKCKQCTKPWIALIVPLIAVVGIALVVGLIFLNLTVSIGTINGLIFYANIVSANNSIFFPQSISNSILRTFIAWLNLDLGIEMCFYNGLDAYSKTWFQFLFPLYIWFMLGAIIVVSHYSTRLSRLVGNYAVQVLATLFLFSYARLLRIIIVVFSSTELVYPDGYHRRVWLYDGNVDYLKGKHIPLFMAALVLLIFISFPFTMILFCTQCMQRLSNNRVLSWVGKLHPLFDAYTGPYKMKHRYWTGLLLLIRVCLFLVFSLNTIGNPMINLLAICITMSCLLAYLSLIGGVYKQWWLNVIETAFILNLLVLSSGSFYQINTGTSIKPIITYTSTGITLVLFICILVYHFILKVIKTKFAQTIKSKSIESDYLRLLTIAKRKSGDQNELECNEIRFKANDEVTYSEVKLQEPLLEDN